MNLKLLNQPGIIYHNVDLYRRGYSPTNLVCGKPRVGKTTKAYFFCHWISHILFNKPWDWRNNTIVSIDQLIKKLNSSTSGDIMLMDEVERQLSRKKWHDPKSQLFSLLMESQARKHFFMFLICPHAWSLGSDHAANVNFVIPCHSRKMVWPYSLDTPSWDISAQKHDPQKFPLDHFDFDIKNDKVLREAFHDELADLENFKSYIDVNLKDIIMDEACEKYGIYNERKPITEKNKPQWIIDTERRLYGDV